VHAGVVPTKDGYDGFVEISKELMRNKSHGQQKQAVLAVLFSLLPTVIPWACKCAPTNWTILDPLTSLSATLCWRESVQAYLSQCYRSIHAQAPR
jgi:hypothetical protein